MIYGFMRTGMDCCGNLVCPPLDVSTLEDALKQLEDHYWVASFCIFYSRDGKFCMEEIKCPWKEPDESGLCKSIEWIEYKNIVLRKIEELSCV